MNKSLSKIGMIVAIATLSLNATSCKKKGCTDPAATNYDAKAKKDDGSCTLASTADNSVQVKGFITSNTTWTADKIYVLNNKVVVNSGVTLTIEAGTIIKGSEGTGTNASALVVARGAKLNAQGTSANPIIFTSVLDNINAGEKVGTSLDEAAKGKWGGVIILGNAPVSVANSDIIGQIEGIPASESYGAYGGNDAADNSGTISYISIRHGGALIGSGNEINGLTLGGVGSGTVINNVEVTGNLDDGIEFFGGTVNVSNLLISYVGDDGIDIDQNYSGTITNFVVVQNVDSDKALEVDGTEGTTNTTGRFKLVDGHVYSKDGGSRPADFKDKAQGTVENLKISGFTLGKIKVRASYQNSCQDVKTDACSNLIASTPKLVFTGCEVAAGVEVYTSSTDGASTPTTCTVQTADQDGATTKVTSVTATGASQTAFNWSWTAAKNKF